MLSNNLITLFVMKYFDNLGEGDIEG